MKQIFLRFSLLLAAAISAYAQVPTWTKTTPSDVVTTGTSAQVSDVGATTGEALVELYELP